MVGQGVLEKDEKVPAVTWAVQEKLMAVDSESAVADQMAFLQWEQQIKKVFFL